MKPEHPAPARPTLVVQIGSRRLTGASAVLIFLGNLLLIGLLLFIFKPKFGWSPLWISAALWMGLIIYWSAAARNSSAARSSESTASRATHQNLLRLGLLLLFLKLPYLTGRWVPDTLGWTLAGLATQMAAFGVAVWARLHLGRHWSGEITHKVGHELVRTGPYRTLRHPIYTGWLGMCLGTAIVSGEWHALLGLGFAVWAYVRKIQMEERLLDGVFGNAYAQYRSSSWALIPGVF